MATQPKTTGPVCSGITERIWHGVRFAMVWAGLMFLAVQGFTGNAHLQPRNDEDFELDLTEVVGIDDANSQKTAPADRLMIFRDRLEDWCSVGRAPLTVYYRRGYISKVEIGRRE